MSVPASFINSYVNNIQTLINIMQELRLQNDMLTQDPTLVTRYFDVNVNSNPRADIVGSDVTAAQAAVQQLIFTFDSGSPNQKYYLYKMMQ